MTSLFPQKTTSHSISNLDALYKVLEVSATDVEFVLNLPPEEKYKRLETIKKSGAKRVVYNPHHKLRKIQKRIKTRILDSIVIYPDYLFGSILDEKSPRDYIGCAQVHCGASTILKIDIKDYFNTISSAVVYEIFSEFLKYPEDVSTTLTHLCTLQGFVPQGSSTASHLANLCFWNTEGGIVKGLSFSNIKYTRFVDDITLSSKDIGTDWKNHKTSLETMINGKGLQINSDKTVSEYKTGNVLSVHGLRIEYKEARLPKSDVKNMRAAVKHLEAKAALPNARITIGYRKQYESISGQISKLKRVGHDRYPNLRKRLSKILPLPSKVDLKRIYPIVERLERDHLEKSTSIWYKKRFYRTQNRLNLIQRIYHEEAKLLRMRLREIKPKNEINA